MMHVHTAVVAIPPSRVKNGPWHTPGAKNKTRWLRVGSFSVQTAEEQGDLIDDSDIEATIM